MDNRLLKWIWLSNRCGAANVYFKTLWDFFGSVDNIYTSNYGGYMLSGMPEKLSEALDRKLDEDDYAAAAKCDNMGVKILCYEDESYPELLRSLKDPPVVLYALGNTDILNHKLCIGVVGTRKMSEYGMRAAYKIAYEVASANAVVVSGMALGIDGVAACAAIASGGQTVAVLGCGIDRTYPKEHEKLKGIIRFHGAVVTEYPPMTPPNAQNFPLRNRIISGLSHGTVVIDADKRSGSMITAKYAVIQGRDIYAVPGNIDEEGAVGANMLLQNGASAAVTGRDIISNYVNTHALEITHLNIVIAENKSELDLEKLHGMGVGTRTVKPSSSEGSGGKASPERSEQRTADTGARASGMDDSGIKFVPSGPSEVHEPDRSGAVLASLNEKQRKIFELMPFDRAVTIDAFASLGYPAGEIISSLMVLEVKGLVQSLPGALYIRK